MSDQKLEPCPFCGGQGFASERTCDKDSPYNPNDRAYPVVRCSKCFVTIEGKDWSSVSTAIDAWNRRVATNAAACTTLERLGYEWKSLDGRHWDWYAPVPAAPQAAQADDGVRDALYHIAALAHLGGLKEEPMDLLCAIRKLSLPWFDGSGTSRDLERRVTRAMIAAKAKGE